MKKLTLIVLCIFMLSTATYGADTCSRIAVINYQEILIDTNSTQKGEGLRFYLEKDPKALQYLNRYQKGTRTHWANAALGTIGSLLLLAGFMVNDSGNSKKSMLIAGSSIIAVNFLVAKTKEHQNEMNLHKAIEEYNKRNLPRIYFSPIAPKSKQRKRGPSNVLGFVVGLTGSF